MKKYLKLILFFLFILLILSGILFYIINNTERNGQINEISQSSYCTVDNDCITAPNFDPESPCCWDCGYEALNKDNFKIREEKRVCITGTNPVCLKKCKGYPNNWVHARCNNFKCEVYFSRPE